MRAIICDKCGKIIGPDNKKECCEMMRVYFTNDACTEAIREHAYDLCGICKEKIYKWINDKKRV